MWDRRCHHTYPLASAEPARRFSRDSPRQRRSNIPRSRKMLDRRCRGMPTFRARYGSGGPTCPEVTKCGTGAQCWTDAPDPTVPHSWEMWDRRPSHVPDICGTVTKCRTGAAAPTVQHIPAEELLDRALQKTWDRRCRRRKMLDRRCRASPAPTVPHVFRPDRRCNVFCGSDGPTSRTFLLQDVGPGRRWRRRSHLFPGVPPSVPHSRLFPANFPRGADGPTFTFLGLVGPTCCWPRSRQEEEQSAHS